MVLHKLKVWQESLETYPCQEQNVPPTSSIRSKLVGRPTLMKTIIFPYLLQPIIIYPEKWSINLGSYVKRSGNEASVGPTMLELSISPTADYWRREPEKGISCSFPILHEPWTTNFLYPTQIGHSFHLLLYFEDVKIVDICSMLTPNLGFVLLFL